MPVKAIIFGVALVATVGYVVYEHREPFFEFAEKSAQPIYKFADRSKQKIADILRRIANEISSDERQREEVPMVGRSLSPQNNPFEDKSERMGGGGGGDNGKTSVVVSGRDAGDQLGHLRHRGVDAHQESTVVFESGGHDNDATVALPASPRRSSVTMSPPAMVQDQLASGSGYDTAPQPLAQHRGDETPSRTASDSENLFVNPQPFWSIHEWQENTTRPDLADRSSSPSLAGSAVDEIDTLSDLASDFGSEGSNSAGSWTEVASEFSDVHQA